MSAQAQLTGAQMAAAGGQMAGGGGELYDHFQQLQALQLPTASQNPGQFQQLQTHQQGNPGPYQHQLGQKQTPQQQYVPDQYPELYSSSSDFLNPGNNMQLLVGGVGALRLYFDG
ncbi:hypothetical protein T492DRAFT_887107 [Pavlovales sp. CCMP2436]|nr:hypothetical protein T492DRAFT_887107 [Pavlovales sp. CCMP2436]